LLSIHIVQTLLHGSQAAGWKFISLRQQITDFSGQQENSSAANIKTLKRHAAKG